MTTARRYADIGEAELMRIRRMVCNYGPTPGDAKVKEWEEVFAEHVGRKHAIAVGSGRLGLKILLRSFGFRDRNEIIVPGYTLADLMPIIQSLELKPVPADIDPATLNMDVKSIVSRITDRTRAILATHLFGNPCDMNSVMEVARRHNLKVIEDCAHSLGSLIGSRRTGSMGHAAFFSFETIKSINTYGGGMIVTDDDCLAESVRKEISLLDEPADIQGKVCVAYLERLFFSTSIAFFPLLVLSSKKGHSLVASLYRSVQHAPRKDRKYSAVQADLGLQKIRTLEHRASRRRNMAEELISLMPEAIRSQQVLPGMTPNYYFFVAILPSVAMPLRRRLLFHGFDAGVGSEITDDCATLLGYKDCPHVVKTYHNAIHLPLHEGMDFVQVKRLANLLRREIP